MKDTAHSSTTGNPIVDICRESYAEAIKSIADEIDTLHERMGAGEDKIKSTLDPGERVVLEQYWDTLLAVRERGEMALGILSCVVWPHPKKEYPGTCVECLGMND